MAAIEAENLTKHYGDVRAVRGIDLTVERGAIHGFVGPNGAGKSTTMGMLVGNVTPTVGTVRIDGEPAGSQAALEKIGYAPQDPVFYESMTGRSYLRYVGALSGVEGRVSDRVEELLDWLDLADAADQSIAGYSGGMTRRLGLAQAMIHDPELLILDEPTAELDPQGRASIIDALRTLADEGKTVFVSSHVLAELEQFIETVTVIDDGRVVTSGPLDDVNAGVARTYSVETTDDETVAARLAEHSAVERVDFGDDSGLTVWVDDQSAFETDLPAVVSDAGLGLKSLRRSNGLEEAFLEMVEDEEEAAKVEQEVR
jgi:ABC-2 type transport system ATP-binding protein